MMIRSERRRAMYSMWVAGAGLAIATAGPLVMVGLLQGRVAASLLLVGFELPVEDSMQAGMTMFVTRLIGSLLAVGGLVSWGLVYSGYFMRDKPPQGVVPQPHLAAASLGTPSTPATSADGRYTSADGKVSW